MSRIRQPLSIEAKQRMQEAKHKYNMRKHQEAATILCACGCGATFKEYDLNGRKRTFVAGHNVRKFKHGDKYAYKKAWIKRNRAWANKRRRTVGHARKASLIVRAGGKCVDCGLEYTGKNGCLFDFHHIDPSTKELSLGSMLTNRAMKDLDDEINKCLLLCGNCHRLRHSEEY